MEELDEKEKAFIIAALGNYRISFPYRMEEINTLLDKLLSADKVIVANHIVR